MADVSVSKEMSASADEVWALVSDLPRMGEWSPENQGGEWIGGATEAVPGAKFRGANRYGKKNWKTVATIVDAEPGRRLSFRVTGGPFKISEWSYDIEPTDTGCTVTESWTDLRPGLMKPIVKVMLGIADRASHNRANMTATLDALAAATG